MLNETAQALGDVVVVAQISGIDVFYIVTYAYYDGANGTGTETFQCTKAGPNPEFTRIED